MRPNQHMVRKVVVRSLIMLGAVVALTGCEPSLFPRNLPRSQYERYSVLRGQQRRATTTNQYGGEVPDLRERLAPLERL